MKKPSVRTRRLAIFAVGPLAILLAGGLVWQSSQAAFTATTRNSGNAWSSGNVVLTDDDLGAAAFTVQNLVPGQTGQKCIVVTSNSTVPGVVKAYQQNLVTSAQGLETHIMFRMEEGTGGSFNSCAGFVPKGAPLALQTLPFLAANNKDYASGALPWTTTGVSGETHSYRATWVFDTTAMTQQAIDALQGARTSADVVWELQSSDAPVTP
jgi:hypothetical protein